MLESVSSHNKLQTRCDLSVVPWDYQYQAASCQQSQHMLQLVSSHNTPHCSLSVVTMNYKLHVIICQQSQQITNIILQFGWGQKIKLLSGCSPNGLPSSPYNCSFSYCQTCSIRNENNSEMQQLRFILRKCFYSTCFGWQSPISGRHDAEQQDSYFLQLHTTHTDRTTLLRTNLLTKCARLPVAIYSTCTPDDGWDCHPKHVE